MCVSCSSVDDVLDSADAFLPSRGFTVYFIRLFLSFTCHGSQAEA